MAISFASFFTKASSAIPFLLTDTDIRGGMRVVPSSQYLLSPAEFPDAIPIIARRTGMLVVTADTKHVHQLASDGVFEDKGLLGHAVATDISLGDSFYKDADGKIQLHEQYMLPPSIDGNPGDRLILNEALEPVWMPIAANPGVGIRTIMSYTAEKTLEGGDSEDFTISMGRSNFLINVSLDVSGVLIEGFSTALRDEPNPYSFKSRVDQLYDDGSTVLADGNIRYARRYALISNVEEPVNNDIYWRFTNHGNLPVIPTLSITYTAIE